MKNKKLFAILTLVCFMFTLMPVAAFAAPSTITGGVYVVDEATSSYDDEATVTAGKDNVVVKVAATTTGSAIADAYVFYAVNEDGEGAAVAKTTDGTATFTLAVAGEYKVYAAALDANDEADTVLESIDTVANKVAKIQSWAVSSNRVVDEYAMVDVEDPEYTYKITLASSDKEDYVLNGSFTTGTSTLVGKGYKNEYSMGIEASEGFVKNGKVVATVEKYDGATWTPVKNQEVKISEAGYVDVAYDTLTTDNKGKVYFVVTSDLANVGNKVIVKYAKATAELTVNAKTANVASVAVSNEPKAPQNNANTIEAANVEFKFTDVNGIAAELVMASERVNTTDSTPGTDGVVNLAGSDIAITLVEKPAKSNMKSSDFGLEKQAQATGVEADAAGVYTLVVNGAGKVDKDGTYVVKVAMKNGASATATVKVAEMGDVVKVMFVKAPTTVAYGETLAFTGAVVAMDANGVIDNTIVPDSVSANGVAVSSFAGTVGGALTAQNDDKYIGETITLLAVYDDFTATHDIVVVDKAATIKYLSTEVEAGINTTLVGQIKDASGKTVPVTGVTGVKMIVLDKPADTVAVASSAIGNALKDGNVLMSFLASAPGEYKVQTVVTYASGAKYISGIETITVGGGVNAFNDVVVVSLGANSMIVNDEVVALDVAPFIENNRTMLQYNVLYVFGIDVDWVPETSSVVAEGNGIKVVMTLGSKVAVVNGEEVALDVAPYVVNGRTVVPAGFITGTFGIAPTFTYNADGSIADILFTK